jgi:hypothetical protein
MLPVPTKQLTHFTAQELLSDESLPTLRVVWLGTSSEYVARRVPGNLYIGVVNANTAYHERREMKLKPIGGSWITP